jgi:hypothetical protein
VNNRPHFARLAIGRPRRRERRQANAIFQHSPELQVGMAMEVEQAHRKSALFHSQGQ